MQPYEFWGEPHDAPDGESNPETWNNDITDCFEEFRPSPAAWHPRAQLRQLCTLTGGTSRVRGPTGTGSYA